MLPFLFAPAALTAFPLATKSAAALFTFSTALRFFLAFASFLTATLAFPAFAVLLASAVLTATAGTGTTGEREGQC